VPADPSSPIPAALTHLTHAGPRQLQDAETPHLLAYLAAVPDPRATRGRRHPLVAILATAAAAVLAGARSIAAIAEWAADAPQPVRAGLGARHHAPGCFAVPAEATIRRTWPAWTQTRWPGAIGTWLADRERRGPAVSRRRAIAVDGKTLRGAHAAGGDGRPVHLLAAMDHTSRAVLAQRQLGGAPEEVPAFQPRLAPLDLAGVVVTADALQTYPDAAEFLVATKHAHCLFQVKANQPTLLDRCQRLPWRRVPELDRTRDRGHGRIELRTLKAVSVHHFGFPRAAQILQVTRKTRDLDASTRRFTTVTVYAVTSLTFQQASPACLADLLRGHWAIEALHHVRDTTFAEDASQIRTGAAPTSWRPCATWPSGCSVGRGRSTSPPRCAATPATHADPSPPLGLASDESTSRQNDGALGLMVGATGV
jgi:predicted transposase YbfD/YdcC